MKRLFTLAVLCFLAFGAGAQVVYEDVSNTGIYEFLDELANQRLIRLNSVVKPYSRSYIAGKLTEATAADTAGPGLPASGHRLNKRQQADLRFYLQDYQLETRRPEKTSRPASSSGSQGMASGYEYKLGFLFRKQPDMVAALNPLGYHYRDSLFTLSVRPILGVQWMTNKNGTEYRRWWGASMFGYIGRNFGFYANLRDNNATIEPAKPVWFNQEPGYVYKPGSQGGVDFSEMRGGITGSVKWGSIGVMNDRIVWGDNYHGANILSGKAPAFPYIQLHLNPVRWFDFNYIHGWLNSNVIDSSRSYYSNGVYRTVYANKFIAANMFTFIPWRGLNISFGNSIIYSDVAVNPLYLVPFLFYNAVDAVRTNYTDYAGSNSQLFINLSSRQIRHLHLFVSFYVDEWKTKRLTDPNLSNFTSLKTGFCLDGFPLKNLALTSEYTRTMPMTYDHYIATTTFSSNDFTLGHYLRENSQEIYVAAEYRPLRGFRVKGWYTLAQHGADVPYRVDAGYNVAGIPFLDPVTWENSEFGLSVRYEMTSGGTVFVQYLNSARTGNERYQPPVMNGHTNTFRAGINFGF